MLNIGSASGVLARDWDCFYGWLDPPVWNLELISIRAWENRTCGNAGLRRILNFGLKLELESESVGIDSDDEGLQSCTRIQDENWTVEPRAAGLCSSIRHLYTFRYKYLPTLILSRLTLLQLARTSFLAIMNTTSLRSHQTESQFPSSPRSRQQQPQHVLHLASAVLLSVQLELGYEFARRFPFQFRPKQRADHQLNHQHLSRQHSRQVRADHLRPYLP